MKILQAMAGAKIGGAEEFFMRLAPALTRAGIDQHVAIRTHPQRRKALTDAGVPVTEMRFGGPLDIPSRLKLAHLAKRQDPDILLAWMSRAAAIAPRGRWTVVARLGGYYDPKYFRRCDHLVANTPDIRRYLIGMGWPDDRVAYLPNFVDDRRLPPIDRAQWDTPADAPLLLCLGRLHKNKGFDIALKALAGLKGCYLWIAGEGPERQALTDLAAEVGIADRVRFLGWRDDAPALFAAADIFLCSSRHEPLGNMVIEAWAQSTPVVAIASQGPSQLIENGRNGLLVGAEDAPGLADATRRLLDDPALGVDLAVQGQAAFEADYTEGRVVARYLEFFERVAPG